MDLNSLISGWPVLPVAEKRKQEPSYCELVFFTKDKEKWNEVLCSFFGPARKPEGAKPSKEDKVLTEEYGGIWRDQTLYVRKEEGTDGCLAMFWPWQDGEHITLKMAAF